MTVTAMSPTEYAKAYSVRLCQVVLTVTATSASSVIVHLRTQDQATQWCRRQTAVLAYCDSKRLYVNINSPVGLKLAEMPLTDCRMSSKSTATTTFMILTDWPENVRYLHTKLSRTNAHLVRHNMLAIMLFNLPLPLWRLKQFARHPIRLLGTVFPRLAINATRDCVMTACGAT